MKEATWKVDPSGTYSFSDATDPNQPVLFSSEPDFIDLERRLRERFGEAETAVQAIEEFVVAETPYRETHYKGQVLKRLESSSPTGLEVVSIPKGRKRGTFPAGTTVRFLTNG